MPEDEDVRGYLEAVSRFPLLSKEEEDELRGGLRSGDVGESEAAKKRLIESQLRLVVTISRRYEGSGIRKGCCGRSEPVTIQCSVERAWVRSARMSDIIWSVTFLRARGEVVTPSVEMG